jgi:hypothetical protein
MLLVYEHGKFSTKQDNLSDNMTDLYFEGKWFIYWPGHRLSLHRFSVFLRQAMGNFVPILSEYFGFPCQYSCHQILYNHNLWLILTIVTIVILLFHLVYQCSVTDLSYITYNDLQRWNKSNQIILNSFNTSSSTETGSTVPLAQHT